MRRQAGLRRELHHLTDAAGVVGVVVGEPDPPKLPRRDDRLQVGEEVALIDTDPGVNEHRLLSEQHERVDQEVPDPWDGHVGGQDVDVGCGFVRLMHA
jgi:hypothetical protein